MGFANFPYHKIALLDLRIYFLTERECVCPKVYGVKTEEYTLLETWKLKAFPHNPSATAAGTPSSAAQYHIVTPKEESSNMLI